MLPKLFLFCIFLISCTSAEEPFPLLPQRYCERNCRTAFNVYKRNVGCNCESTDPIKGLSVIESDQKFREAVLDKLNEFRNEIAAGNVEGFPSATNMLALNYDVGLEYSAYCASKVNIILQKGVPCLRNKEEGGVDYFATMEKKSKLVDLTKLEVTLTHLAEHLDLIRNLTLDIVKKWEFREAKYMKVSTLVYYMFNKVGCYRYMHPKSTFGNARYVIFCALGTLYGPQSYFTPDHKYFYESGDKCSSCPLIHYYGTEQMPCNSKYSALCGEVAPVPTYKWNNGTLPDEPWLNELWYTASGDPKAKN